MYVFVVHSNTSSYFEMLDITLLRTILSPFTFHQQASLKVQLVSTLPLFACPFLMY